MHATLRLREIGTGDGEFAAAEAVDWWMWMAAAPRLIWSGLWRPEVDVKRIHHIYLC